MGWTYNPTSWIDGTTVPHAADFVDIYNDLHTWGDNVDAASSGLTNSAFVGFNPGVVPGTQATITGAVWAASVATYTIGAYNIKVGQLVSVTGVTPSGYNITKVAVTATTGTTFSVAMASNPGAWSSGGTVQVSGIPAASGMLAIDQNGALSVYDGSLWGLKLPPFVNGVLVQGIGTPCVVALVDLLAQNTGSVTVPLYSIPGGQPGMYRVIVAVQVTRAATTSSTLPSVSIVYFNEDSGVSTTVLATSSSAGNTTTTVELGVVTVPAELSLSYTLGAYASVGATSMQYDLHIRVEFLG